MKIVQISPYYPPHLGGVEQRVRDLSERLAKKGNNIEVFTSNIGCPKNKQLKSTKNLKTHYLKAKEFAHTPIMPSLYEELMKIPQDSIMHVHAVQAYAPEIVWLVSKLRGIPYITHLRADVIKTGKLGFLLPLYKNFFLKKILKDSERVITLTKDFKELCINKYCLDKNKIIILPNATDFKITNPKIFGESSKLLFVGRLSIDKNIPLLIKSFKLLQMRNSKSSLGIVGEGPEKENLKKMIKTEKLEKEVNVKGRLDGKKLEREYQNSDILVFTSKGESFGTVLIEAMASGLPIVATDVMGVRNIIKNNYNGLLVKPTPEKIAEAIEKLIKNPNLRKKLSENGLKEVKKYSWDKIVEQTEKVYKQVLSEHNHETPNKKTK